MEENCLASEAYRIRHENPDFSLETRRLLRFVYNISLQFTAQWSIIVHVTISDFALVFVDNDLFQIYNVNWKYWKRRF